MLFLLLSPVYGYSRIRYEIFATCFGSSALGFLLMPQWISFTRWMIIMALHLHCVAVAATLASYFLGQFCRIPWSKTLQLNQQHGGSVLQWRLQYWKHFSRMFRFNCSAQYQDSRFPHLQFSSGQKCKLYIYSCHSCVFRVLFLR